MLRQNFNAGWTVTEDRSWFAKDKAEPRPVHIPHDAMIETQRDENVGYWFPYGGFVGKDVVYRKTFTVPGEWLSRQVMIEFEGVYYQSEVLLNGSVIAAQPYGYSRFLVDCTGFLVEGENTLQVTVHAGSAPNSRWYPGTGIYRDVWLMVGESAYIRPWGVFVRTERADSESAALVVTADLTNRSSVRKELWAQVSLLSPTGEAVASTKNVLHVRGGDQAQLRQHFAIPSPSLWSPENPALYTVEITLFAEGKAIDTVSDRFGIRTITVDALRGFCVNGVPYKLRGGCIHHDNGPIGSAEFASAAKRRVAKMKEAGYNAIRSSHNPMSNALLQACDELGVFVMDESFDTWNQPKTAYDYNRNFATWWEKDTRSMVEKDYNHPCVVMYSIGNEIVERDGTSDGGFWVRRQAEFIRSLDPTRPVTSALCNIHNPSSVHVDRGHWTGKKGVDGVPAWGMMPEDIAFFIEKSQDYADGLDVCGMNYLQKTYTAQHDRFPHRVLCGTESMVAQYGEVWDLVDAHPYIIGDFCWTAWEYLGEAGCGVLDYEEDGHPRALSAFMGDYPWVMAYCGDFDLTGDRRTQSYYREIVWGLRKTPYIGVQRLHRHGMTPNYSPWSWSDTVASWTWPGFEGKETDVEVYASGDEAELWINGISQGRQPIADYRATWTVCYESGTIEAVSYENGREVGRYALHTHGTAVRLQAEIDMPNGNGTAKAGCGDVAYVRVTLLDEKGRRVYGTPTVRVHVEGALTLAGFGSGDPVTDHNYWEDTCALFDGTAVAVVRTKDLPGTGRITFEAEGLEGGSVEITVC